VQVGWGWGTGEGGCMRGCERGKKASGKRGQKEERRAVASSKKERENQHI